MPKEYPGESGEEIDKIVPLDWGNRVRACLSCSLVKTANQFLTRGCENCDFLGMAGDRAQVMDCTSTAIIGMYTVMQPRFSWVAKWQRTVKYRPGCYAIAIDATLPEDVEEKVAENGARVGRTRATTVLQGQ